MQADLRWMAARRKAPQDDMHGGPQRQGRGPRDRRAGAFGYDLPGQCELSAHQTREPCRERDAFEGIDRPRQRIEVVGGHQCRGVYCLIHSQSAPV